MAEPRTLFTTREAARVLENAGLGGVSLLGSGELQITSVVIDSRAACQGALFVALPGSKADGHEYIGAAFAAGASCVLARADRRAPAEAAAAEAAAAAAAKATAMAPGARSRSALLFVEEPLAALQALAHAHRARFPKLRRIGITGSSGKTTTKECAAAILGRSRSLVLNPGNLNSDIGLSLSVFAIEEKHEIGVFEMGMNRAGEMGELAGIYEPDIGLITNVGTAHIGILGDRDKIAEEKKAIFSRFNGHQAGFIWEDDEYKAFLKEGVRGEIIEFGPRSTRGFRGARDRGLDGYEVDWEGLRFEFPLAGRHALLDAIAAMAIAERVGTPPQDVAEGLASVKPLFGRGEVIRGEITLLQDCYNANPDSVEAAIALCDGIDWKGRRAYVLGTMLELGAESLASHRRIGAAAGRSRAQALFFFGEEARPAFEEARLSGFRGLAVYETDFDRLRAAARAWIGKGDLVLLKGSRGMALERLVDAFAPLLCGNR